MRKRGNSTENVQKSEACLRAEPAMATRWRDRAAFCRNCNSVSNAAHSFFLNWRNYCLEAPAEVFPPLMSSNSTNVHRRRAGKNLFLSVKQQRCRLTCRESLLSQSALTARCEKKKKEPPEKPNLTTFLRLSDLVCSFSGCGSF